MDAGILPFKGEKLLRGGISMEIVSAKLLHYGGMKPVIKNTGKSPLTRTTRMPTQKNCLIILWRNQSTGEKKN